MAAKAQKIKLKLNLKGLRALDRKYKAFVKAYEALNGAMAEITYSVEKPKR